MNRIFGAAFMAATLSVATGAASADEMVRESRTVDARVLKVKLGGVISLRITQGDIPSLVLYGDKDHVSKVITRQTGDTLQIDTESPHIHFGRGNHELRADLTLPKLSELVSRGVGSTEVDGFSGEELKLVLDGAGALKVTANYKNVDARLGGVGSMNLNTGVNERVGLRLNGAGHVTLHGQSKLLHAKLGGVGGLDAQALQADAVELEMSGLGGAKVFARESASLKLNGLGSATVYGKPAKRSSSARGLGSVSWK